MDDMQCDEYSINEHLMSQFRKLNNKHHKKSKK